MENQEQVNEVKMDLRQIIGGKHGEELVGMLENMHPLDSNILIRQHVTIDQIKELKGDKALYDRFKAVRQKGIDAYNYANQPAKMGDVDRAATNVYVILLKMIKAVNDEVEILKSENNRLRIEGGLEPLFDDNIEVVQAEPTETQEGADTGKDEPTTDL